MSSFEHMSILACQIDIPKTRTKNNRNMHLEAAHTKVSKALRRGPTDLVVLPELSSLEYSRCAFERLEQLAEPLSGPSFDAWREVACEFATHVAYSFPRQEGTNFHITLAVVGPTGDLVGYYDKIHLAQFGASVEKEYFRPGERLFVFDIKGFRIAPIICSDIRIPELSRKLTIDHGADIIIHSGAYARDPSFYSWHNFAITRALENQVFFLSLNRAGLDFGKSMFCPPWVDQSEHIVSFDEHDEHFEKLIVDRRKITLARDRYPFLKDRLQTYNLPLAGTTTGGSKFVK